MPPWPAEFEPFINALVGDNVVSATPGGMSGASVSRFNGDAGSVILKQASNAREWHVYTRLGALLQGVGVRLPELYASHVEDGCFWMLLEDIPTPLPEARWLADPEVLGMLARLHTLPVADVVLPDDRYQPGWTADLTHQALELFSPQDARACKPVLEAIRQRAQSLFSPLGVISGDPNPANWGIRADGTLVLFDWERCTLAHPAIDLAITVPGLGDMEAFRLVAGRYPASGVRPSAEEIARAKVWAVVEFLAGMASGEVDPPERVRRMIGQIPGWLTSLEGIESGS